MKSSVFKKENILKKIIMVSTNNTCRSFIAESILRQYLLDANQKNVEVISRGLVGGHCIGVDPYYLTYKAEMLGYHSQVILSGRRINDDMGKYVAENVVKKLIAADKAVRSVRVAILGFTFKENCPDTRNSKVMDIVNELREYGIEPVISDPVADADEANS